MKVLLPLLPKMAARLAMVNKTLGSDVLVDGQMPPVNIVFGAYIPADVAAVVERIVQLLPVHALSTQTAVTWLVDAGLAIDSAEAEVKRIRAEAAERAAQTPGVSNPDTPPADPSGAPTPVGGPTT